MAARNIAFVVLACCAALPAQQADPVIDLDLLSAMKARSIGPAVCSGRIGAVAGVPGDPTIVWAGASAGGVWKSTDGGISFEAVFDDQDVASIGAIAIHPRNRDDVWVGSGEGNPRNSASVGRGIYRSRDGGRSWTRLGLEQTERIHRILVHPDDPDTAWVAAFGTSWGENEQRGVFKTSDGGKTWRKVLYVDERTGCADLVLDPDNPDKLFASMWQHRRWPWAFRSGGPGSGLHRSLDGGETWHRLGSDDGLPKGELGRIGLAIAPSDPRVVYALTEAKKSVLLRSDDGGFRFRTVNKTDGIAPRPFYFCDIRVDPRDPNRVYNMHTVIDVSTDGGRSFDGLVGWNAAHPDHHSMWIDPLDPRRILIGNDGGVYSSSDHGESWRFCSNLPLAQFYHVAVDDAVPYNIYGGLQDNGSWRGPSNVWENGGIRNLHWQEVCFGDGFATIPDPDDHTQGYAMSQGGSLVRWDARTGARKSIRPPDPVDIELRFHWNAAIAIDPFDPATVYYGSQFVHRSSDRGGAWQVISPDLTSNNPEWQKQDESGGLTLDVTAAENHCTILTIAPSPVAAGTIWVGTDDGRVHVTTDGGESWSSVEGNIDGRPAHTWCPHIEASKFDAATAFAVFDGHRNADWTSYVYVTRDHGRTWQSLATDDIDGYCHCIEQDPVQRDLLWVGTEFGLHVSLDGGGRWHRYRHGVPTCAARAITTHPRDGDLVVATHGRSVFVIDDISPLRTLDAEVLAKALHVFAPRAAYQHEVAQTPSTRFPGKGEFRGETLRPGVMLQVLVGEDDPKAAKKDAQVGDTDRTNDADKDEAKAKTKTKAKAKDDDGKATFEVRNPAGELVRTFRRTLKKGLNRVHWRFERDGVQYPSRKFVAKPEVPPPGRQVLPGDYTISVSLGEHRQDVAVTVLADPRVTISDDDRKAKDALRAKGEALTTRMFTATQKFAPFAARIAIVKQRLALEPKPEGEDEPDPHEALRKALTDVEKAHQQVIDELWGKEEQVQGIRRGPAGRIRKARGLIRVSGTDDAPNRTELDSMARAEAKVDEVCAAVDAFADGPMQAFRAAVAASGITLLPKEQE